MKYPYDSRTDFGNHERKVDDYKFAFACFYDLCIIHENNFDMKFTIQAKQVMQKKPNIYLDNFNMKCPI
jgi:hypothetical protein